MKRWLRWVIPLSVLAFPLAAWASGVGAGSCCPFPCPLNFFQ